MTFKPGDKVRCIEPDVDSCFGIVGLTYTLGPNTDNGILDIDGYYCSASRFELVQPASVLTKLTSEQFEELMPHPKQDVGLKYDQGKPPMSLLATGWLQGVANALGFGAKKYGPYNWRNGIEQSRLIDAAMRHITAYNNGEDLDPESGLSHIYHASCCLMFASELLKSHPQLDDRYKVKNEK